MNTKTPKSKNAENNISYFKKVKAMICKHCPACNYARKNPGSTIGKILHHPLHSNHCPIWKAYEELYGQK